MGGDDDTHSFVSESVKLIDEQTFGAVVKTPCRFIKEKNIGLCCQNNPKRQRKSLPFRKVSWVSIPVEMSDNLLHHQSRRSWRKVMLFVGN
jgi:hypothetical protein